VYFRLDRFWTNVVLPLRKTEAIVLIVSHGGIISVLRKYLMAQNYGIHDSLMCGPGERYDFEVRNCSISEIVLEERGPGEFIKLGSWDHIMQALDTLDTKDRLKNSTGESL